MEKKDLGHAQGVGKHKISTKFAMNAWKTVLCSKIRNFLPPILRFSSAKDQTDIMNGKGQM